MATALMNVYHAFRTAGVPEDQAQKATEEIAGYENRFTAIDAGFAKIEGELGTVKWMVGVVIALVLGVLGILLRSGVH